MTPEIIFYLLIWVLIFEFILTKTLSFLNFKNYKEKLPKELSHIYDEEKYKKSVLYEKTKYKFSLISWIYNFFILFIVLYFYLFWYLDSIVSNLSDSYILRSLLFFAFIYIIQTILTLPFSYFYTFKIEWKFWFNKQTKSLFFIDILKSSILTFIIAWIILSAIIFIYQVFNSWFFVLSWVIISLFSIFFMMFYSSLIVPIFNKQIPLKKWKLREDIEDFSKKVWFKLDNIFVIDWSKRSSKANAYFSWIWSKKRIVLYDTLINDLTNEELVAVLAHEIGHYKKKHTLEMLVFSLLQMALILYIFSLVVSLDSFSLALWWNSANFHLWIISFMILFSPISMILWIFWNILSRKNEYEADEFSVKNYSKKDLENALIKLSKNNLSNLNPHPLYEFFYYSHPSLLKRLKAIGASAKLLKRKK